MSYELIIHTREHIHLRDKTNLPAKCFAGKCSDKLF